jgi:hypothetical protein
MPRIPRLIRSIGFVAILLALGVEHRTARADDCLAEPGSSAPEGNHWYYHPDRATQRKCWYLRAPDQPAAQSTSDGTPINSIPLEKPATASAGAPTSVTPGAGIPPPPHIKMLAVVNSGAADKLVQQPAKQQNTTSITAASAPEESTSQTGVQATEPARAAAIVWPDPPTPQDPVANPIAAPTEAASTESGQPAPVINASADGAEPIAQADASANSAGGAKASAVAEPVEMSLVAALALMVAGFLFRVAMARRRRIIIDQSESHWMDDRNEHESRDRQQRSGSVHQWNELSNDLQRPLMPTAGDYRPRYTLRKDYESQENPLCKDRNTNVTDEISKREDMFEQLRRDLDRLLRSPKVA